MITPVTSSTARKRSLVLVLRLAIAAAAVMVLAGCLNPAQTSVLDRVNATRSQAGLAPLSANLAATIKAQKWAQHLARQGSLSHSNLSSGMDGVPYSSIAENVGWSTAGIAGVHAQYLASPAHRANILGNWRYIGVGHATRGTKTYTVQVFFR